MTIKARLGAVETPLARYENYQKAFRLSAVGNVVMAFALVISQVIAWTALSAKPENIYFATYEDGGIIPLVPISEPFLNNGQVINFAVEAITNSFSMDFLNWRKNLSDASGYFEQPDGWNNFLTALDNSGILDFIKNRRLISNSIINEAFVIDDGIDIKGRYYWTVQIKMKITYESSSERSTDNYIADVVVSRIPVWENSRAVGITRVNVH